MQLDSCARAGEEKHTIGMNERLGAAKTDYTFILIIENNSFDQKPDF
jgi:hypothetical protein